MTDAKILEAVKAAARAAARLQQAVLARDEDACLEGVRAVLAFDAEHLEHVACDEEAEVRRVTVEVVDAALRGVLLADDAPGEAWRRLVLPSELGVLAHSLWMSNARWLRATGSPLPDENDERLDPDALAGLPFGRQARALGRYCAVNDAAREVDVPGVLAALDPRLLPAFVDWLLGVHHTMPAGVVPAEVEHHQEVALEALLARRPADPKGRPLPSSPLVLSAAYDGAYREAGTSRATSEWVVGSLAKGLFDRFRGKTPPLDQTPELAAGLERARVTGEAVLCPNWRDSHVAYRCMGPLLEGLRERGAPVFQPVATTTGAPVGRAAAWAEQSYQVNFDGRQHFLVDGTRLADALAACDLELLVYPEVTPSNCSVWLATQRLARVQVMGYGVPVTSGSPNMDYMLGGADVEPPGAERNYAEQLVLLPGFGVSTLEPPTPSAPRSRPDDDGALRLVSTATHRKLKAPLLRAWGAILDRPGASMDLFPAMRPRDLALQVPAMGAALGEAADVRLHPLVERQVILDTLVEADLYLDTYPFGGFNSLVEVLACGVPFVTLEGDQARNRFGAAMLRRVGLPEFLVAKDYDGYVAAARRVLDDAGLRRELRARLADRGRVLALLADPDMAEHLEAARAWMLERGPRTGRPHAPVLIRAGERPAALSA